MCRQKPAWRKRSYLLRARSATAASSIRPGIVLESTRQIANSPGHKARVGFLESLAELAERQISMPPTVPEVLHILVTLTIVGLEYGVVDTIEFQSRDTEPLA